MKTSTLIALLSVLVILGYIWGNRIHQQNSPMQYELEFENDSVVSNRVNNPRWKQIWPGPARTRPSKDAEASVESSDDDKIIAAHGLASFLERLSPEQRGATARFFKAEDVVLARRNGDPQDPLEEIPTWAGDEPTWEELIETDKVNIRNAERTSRRVKRQPPIHVSIAEYERRKAGLRATLGDEGFEEFMLLREVQNGVFMEVLRRMGASPKQLDAAFWLVIDKRKTGERQFSPIEDGFMTRMLGWDKWQQVKKLAELSIHPAWRLAIK